MSTKTTILLIEDNPGDARLVKEYLFEKGSELYDFKQVDNLQKGLNILRDQSVAVILLDLSLPDSHGIDTFINLHAQVPGIPVVVLTGNDDDEMARQAVHLGAQDYLVKNQINASVLNRVVNYSIERNYLNEEMKKLNRTLRVLSKVNRTVIRSDNEFELIKEICDVAVHLGNYPLVWVGYHNNETGKVSCVGYAGVRDKYKEVVDVTCKNSDDRDCPICQAIETKTVVTIQNIQATNLQKLKEKTGRYGLKSLIVFPLLIDSDLKGAVNIYSDQANGFNPNEVNLLTELAGDLAFGIRSIRIRHESIQAQKALQESHRHFDSMLKNPLDYVLYRTKAGSNPMENEVTHISPSVIDILGIDEADMYDFNKWFVNIHPDDLPRVIEANARGCKPPFEFDEIVRINHPSRGLRWLQVRSNGIPKEDDPESIEFANGIILDITDQKNAESKLQKTEALNRAIVDNSRDCIKLLDLAGNLVFMSAGGQKLLEIDNIDQVLNQSWLDFWKDEDRQNAEVAIAQALEGDLGYFEGYCPTMSGKPKWWGVLVSPIYDEKGQVESLLSVSRDITDRKKDEKERNHLQKQLLQSQKMDAVGQLAGGVAHDFNNLLTIISGNTELLFMKSRDGDIQGNLNQIKKATEKAAALTRQLLTFSRKQVVEPRITRLNAIVEGMLKMLGRLIGEDITLNTELAENLPTIKADDGQIEQVLMNLVVNARDAMPEGGQIDIVTDLIRISEKDLKRFPGASAGNYNRLTVSDTGKGMSVDVLEHIFEPFFTTKESGKGTGLGLAVIYGIVEDHKGWIDVESEPEAGTTFRVYLPVCSESVEDSGPGSDDDQPDSGSATIMIVEDDDAVRVLTKSMLERNGNTVFESANCTDGLKMFKEKYKDLDLVLCDVVLPDGSGLTLAEAFAEMNNDVVILMTSGYLDDKAHLDQIKSKGFHFVQKPYNYKDFIKLIKSLT